MERKANYTLVGFGTLLLIVAAVAFAFWLARFQFNRDFDLYDIKFVGPVNGLNQGGEARFNGIKVGEVTKIALDSHDPSLVVARIRVASDVPIKTDSFATLEPQNITGVSYVQIAAGSTQAKLLKEVTPKGQVPLLRSQASTLSNLLEGGGTLLARAVEALDRVNRVLSDKNITTFGATLSDINVVSNELKSQKEVFGDARSSLQAINKTAADYSELAKHLQTLVDTDGKSTLKNANDAVAEIKAAAADARQLVAALKAPTTDFATNGLPQLQSAIISLQGTAESLDRLANEIEANPRALVGKEPAKEIKVKP